MKQRGHGLVEEVEKVANARWTKRLVVTPQRIHVDQPGRGKQDRQKITNCHACASRGENGYLHKSAVTKIIIKPSQQQLARVKLT
jgi:hypothetical protein